MGKNNDPIVVDVVDNWGVLFFTCAASADHGESWWWGRGRHKAESRRAQTIEQHYVQSSRRLFCARKNRRSKCDVSVETENVPSQVDKSGCETCVCGIGSRLRKFEDRWKSQHSQGKMFGRKEAGQSTWSSFARQNFPQSMR